MKKQLFTFLSLLFILCYSVKAQSPERIKYQAVIRDASSNNILAEQNVGMLIKVIQGSITGTVIYEEAHNLTTNTFGLVNLEIGGGTINLGSFTNIDWGNGPFFIETSVDKDGGTNYSILGTSELLSVPYALYANEAGNNFWDKNNSDIFYNNGNIGIGTSTPETYIHVSGHNARTLMDANGISSSTGHQFRSFRGSTGSTTEGEFRLYNTNKFVFNRGFVPNQTELVTIDLPTGNVGIGTLDPETYIHVSGHNARTLVDANGISSSTGHQFRSYRGTTGSTTEGEFRLYNTNKFVFNRGFVPNQTELVTIDLPTGNLGIGTLEPAAKIEVTGGDIYIEDVNKGVIMTSPDGQCWRMTVDNSGAMITTSVSCPQ